MQKVPGSPAGENFQHAADPNNHLIGYSYDAAGNLLNDGINAFNYAYDAENRIAIAGATSYTYDADGRRIKKSSGTNYWYGPGGQALAETDAGGNWTFYIFFGGQRLARNIPQPAPNPADIKYYVTDHLHSTAIFADKSGAVLDDNDFYPWGGVVPGVGSTTSTNHYKFTGKERDAETNLDYFGARYYANVTGRFMTPDWAAKPISVPYAEFGDPQSLNLYSYVRNSPVLRIDPDGHSYAGMNGLDRDTSGEDATAGWGDSQSSMSPDNVVSGSIDLGDTSVTHGTGQDPHNHSSGSSTDDMLNESGTSNKNDNSSSDKFHPDPPHNIIEAGKGERRKTGRPDGTDDPFKKLKPDPNDPDKVIYKDPHTGKEKRKEKPPVFDEYWKKKHP